MKFVQVKRVVEKIKDFPELGERIRQARERDGRPLTIICKECGVSRSYWYQLENENLLAPATEGIIRKIENFLGVDLGVNFND
ncbi:hypothetical protein Cylst_5183 [Cylindrospermum stagnale PCC 7417]|uniref:Helix-turn-helix protein n=1 Tax=Cylindrospermum stagnale PCC 7417 TaxID=56107 RepID=K9X6F8_9NOST|nr:helix-turn-helix transcriptional regulator [Cylindrospermum stagnale]AFZ27222.1 hypothetical protein Cylst_5183 [Cylindrospermum stagnale PCC 7417]